MEFNRQLTRDGLQSFNLRRLKKGGYDGVVVIGMGGSGLAGELLKNLGIELGLNLPVFTWKDYGLPPLSEFGLKKPLYVFVSFSGNTQETLSGFNIARRHPTNHRQKINLAAMTHDGELARLALKHKIPLVIFPAADLNPRQYLGKMFYGLTQILHTAHLLTPPPDYTNLNPRIFKAEGKKLARRLHGRVILLYTDRQNYGLGYAWKVKLNETAKQLAFLNLLPEMNHHELAGLLLPKIKLGALFLTAGDGKLSKRVKINLKLLQKMGIWSKQLSLPGRNRLIRTWNGLMLADWTTYYLAKLNQVDPSENRIVEKLKVLMEK